MEGVSLTFNAGELFTRAKKQLSTQTAGSGFEQTNAAQCPERNLPWTGPEIQNVSWAPQVHLPSTVQTVYIQYPPSSCREYGILLKAKCQVFTWFTTHVGTLPHTLRRQVPVLPWQDETYRGRENRYEDVLFSTLSLVLWSTAGDLSYLGGTISSHLPNSFLV